MKTAPIFAIFSLLLCLFLSPTASAEIMGFAQDRTMNDTAQYHWLMETKYKIPRDSTLHQLQTWALEKKTNAEWHDFLFLENEIANILSSQRRYSEGIERLEQARELFAQHCDTIHLEYAYGHYLFSSLRRNSAMTAMDSYEKAIAIMKAMDHHSTFYTNCLFFLGSTYYATGYIDKTIQVLKELEHETAFNAITRINTDALIAKLFGELQPDYAVKTLEQTIANIDSLNSRRYLAYKGSYIISLGRYYGRCGKLEKEKECYHKAVDIFTGSPDYVNLSICYQNLAYANIKEGNFAQALPYLATADSIATTRQHKNLQYHIIELYGYLYEKEGNIDSALSYYEKAEAMILSGQFGNMDRLADLYSGMAELYATENKPTEVLYYATKAINIYNGEQAIEPSETPQYLRPLKDANIDIKITKPLRYYIESLPQCTSENTSSYVYRAEEYLDTIFCNLMNYSIENDVIIDAREYTIPAYNIALNYKTEDYLTSQDNRDAFRALSTADGLKSSVLLFEKRCLESTYMNNDSLDTRIAALEMRLETDCTSKDSMLYQLEITKLKTKKFQNNLKLLLEEEGEFVRLPQLDQSLMSDIPEATSLVEYHLADSVLYTFVIDHENIELVKTPLNTELQKLTQRALREIKTASLKSTYTNQLSEIIIAPIQDLLQDNIVFIPDESFSLFPLECLKSQGQLLIAKHNISYSYSINLWRENKSSQQNRSYSALAVAPTFETSNEQLLAEYRTHNADSTNGIFRDDHLKDLPYSRQEVDEIYKIFSQNQLSCQRYMGAMATEANVRQVFNNYSILHLATHGVVSKNNEAQTGLFLSNIENIEDYEDNGFLSMKELFNIDMTADLVVLSACKTAYGRVQRTEGVISLPRSFIYAGVPNIIASLWKVQDKNTAYLMERFYHHLLNNKLSYAASLSQAKRDCIHQGQLAMDWSSFILIGK